MAADLVAADMAFVVAAIISVVLSSNIVDEILI